MNQKAIKYAGQLLSIQRKDMTFSVQDRLSLVNDEANATYLEMLHPAATYQMSILGDIKNGISVKANIRPEHLNRIMMRVQFAESVLFKKDAGLLAAAGSVKQEKSDQPDDITKSEAFTVKFKMGNFNGKSPAAVIIEADDKKAAVESLHKQKEFLARNAERFAYNKTVMSAIDKAVNYYEFGMLDGDGLADAAEAQRTAGAVPIYAPPTKTFRKETKEVDGAVYTKAYDIKITFDAEKKYPYDITIKNQFVKIKKNEQTKMEVINYVSGPVAEMHEYTIHLTSDEMVYIITRMVENKDHYEGAAYAPMRKKDQNIQTANRQAWAPKG